MNDPNGLIFHDGRYAVFAQFSADAPDFKSIGWGRWSSPDMLAWQFDGECIPPDRNGFAYSGSVVGNQGRLEAFLTRHDPSTEPPVQRQWKLVSGDGGHDWSSGPTPLGPEGRDMRDPFVFRCAATNDWRMLVAEPCNWNAAPGTERSRLAIWRSDDREAWEPAGHIGAWSPPNVMWEVPVLLDFGVRQALVVSMVDRRTSAESSVEYWTGRFDGYTFDRAHDESVRLDEGSDFYAACFNTAGSWPDASRTMVAWASNWATARTIAWPGAINGGPLTLPRTIELRDHRLLQRPMQNAVSLAKTHHWQSGEAMTLTFETGAAQAEIQIDPSGTLHATRRLSDGSTWSRSAPGFARKQGTCLLFDDNGLIELFSASGSTFTMFVPR